MHKASKVCSESYLKKTRTRTNLTCSECSWMTVLQIHFDVARVEAKKASFQSICTTFGTRDGVKKEFDLKEEFQLQYSLDNKIPLP